MVGGLGLMEGKRGRGRWELEGMMGKGTEEKGRGISEKRWKRGDRGESEGGGSGSNEG